MRTFRALVWLRWRTLVNTLRGRRQSRGERVSRFLHMLVPVILTLLIVPSAIALGLLGLAGGWMLASGSLDADLVIVVVRVMFAVLSGLVVVWPLIRSSHGAQDDLARLLLLPIPRRALHLGELAAGLSDPWILAFLPALILFPVGLLWAGSVGAGLVVLAAGLVLLFLLLAMGACASFLLQLLLRDRKRAEAIALILLIVISVGSFVPMLLLPEERLEKNRGAQQGARDERPAGDDLALETTGEPAADAGEDVAFESSGERSAEGGEDGALPSTGERSAAAGEPPAQAPRPRRAQRFPAWAQPAPSELYGRTVALATGDGSAAALLPLVVLLFEASAVYAVSRRVHARLLETPASSGGTRGGARRRLSIRRLPGLSEASSAVAMAQFRTFLRTVKGKLAALLAPLNIAALGLVAFRYMGFEPDQHGFPIDAAALLTYMAVAFSLLGAHPVLLNMFATDRAGLTMQFLAPVSDRELVLGKVAGCGMLASIPAMGGALAALLVSGGGSPVLWVTALLGGLSSFLLFAPAAAFLSALLPRESDLSSIGTKGNPHAAAGLVGLVLTLAALAPPAILALIGLVLLRSPGLTLALAAAWTAIASGTAWLGLRVAAGVLGERRESLALIARRR